MKIVFLAPFHSEYDKRVSNSIMLSKETFEEIVVLYDSNYNKVKIGKVGQAYFYPVEISTFLKFKYPNFKKWIFEIENQIKNCDIIYIHDSGIMGLIISNLLSKYKKPIVLDYHDNVFYELYYQLKKNKLSVLYPFIKYPVFFYLKNYVKNISFLIGINQIQLDQFKKFFKYKNDHIVIDNNRYSYSEISQVNRNFDTTELLWIGNVMRGRDLEIIIKILAEKNFSRFNIIGNILDVSFQKEIINILGDRVVFHGSFSDENNINEIIKFKPIGIYLGWDDPYNTLINEMSSPNKIYTYINLSIPFIFSSKFINKHSIIDETVGCSINAISYSKITSEELENAFNKISSNYELYLDSISAFKIKTNTLENIKTSNYFNEIKRRLI
jgi:hypothetical protein